MRAIRRKHSKGVTSSCPKEICRSQAADRQRFPNDSGGQLSVWAARENRMSGCQPAPGCPFARLAACRPSQPSWPTSNCASFSQTDNRRTLPTPASISTLRTSSSAGAAMPRTRFMRPSGITTPALRKISVLFPAVPIATPEPSTPRGKSSATLPCPDLTAALLRLALALLVKTQAAL